MSTVPMAAYKRGPRTSVDYVPPANVNAGDVIVVGDATFICDVDDPIGTGLSIIQTSVFMGGQYLMAADAAYPNGTYVWWNPTAQQVTTGSGGTVPFGWIVAGPDGLLSDAGPTGSASICYVNHDPQASGGNLTFQVGAVANDNISNTSAATNFQTSATIPVGTLEVGDVISIKAEVVVLAQNSTNTNLILVNMLTGANTNTALYNSTATSIAANGLVYTELAVVVTGIGNTGSFYATGLGGSNAAPTKTYVANTALNTNEAITITVNDTQSAASTGNNSQLALLNVSILRK
jgi:predicted RecA/RadA family phage recombinase